MTFSFIPKKDVFTIATEYTLQFLERGIVPWLTHWTAAGIPQNLVTRKEYTGINIFLLAALGYPKNFFLSPKQLYDIGGTPKQGEQPHPLFYWKWPEQSTHHLFQKRVPILRYSYVYNVAQCSGIGKSKIPRIRKPLHPLEMCFSIFGNMPNRPTISHGSLPAMYMPTLDCIDIPSRNSYSDEEAYYSTLFRCLIQSTGHESRLHRFETTGNHNEITESLICDIGVAHLCSLAGIKFVMRKDLGSYASEWAQHLKKDSRLIVYASDHAQLAVDYILRWRAEKFS